MRRWDCREASEITEAVSRRASGWQVQRDQDGLKGKQRVRTSPGNSSGAVTMETGDPQSQALATWRPVWLLRCAQEEGTRTDKMSRTLLLPYMVADEFTVIKCKNKDVPHILRHWRQQP